MASGAHDLDAHLQLRTDERDLTATLRVGPKVPADQVDAAVFAMFLASRGVNAKCVDGAALDALVEAVRAGPGAEHAALVARGRQPRDGAGRVLAWEPDLAREIERITARRKALVEQSSPEPRPAADADETAIDFYNQSAFVIVHAGWVLGTVSPPDPGEDGEDVFGNAIPARQSPAPSDIDPETIELTRDNRLVALVRGRLVHSGAKRCIQRTLCVDADVGFETGNIDFPGPVEIAGGVRDRFVVRAQGAVTVRKLVEAATIESRRDVVVERGAAGRETGRIIAGGSVKAGYLEGVGVTCAGDCEVRHEITNCRVDARGVVRVPAGAIRGGRVTASRGVEAAVVGSVQETRTELIVGALDELEELIRQARDRIGETQGVLGPLLARQEVQGPMPTGSMAAEQIEARMSLEFEASEAKRRIDELGEACERLEDNLRAFTAPVLRATQFVHPGVVLWLPGYRATFKSTLKGESVVRLDASNRPVVDVRGETHRLSKFALVEPDARVVLPPARADDAAERAA